MSTETIDAAFADMIAQKGIEGTLGIERNLLYQLRSRLKNGQAISTERKLELLKKTGWRESDEAYTWQDLVSLVIFVLKTSEQARKFGAEYVVEKWEKQR